MAKSNMLFGAASEIVTPFKENGEINFKLLEEEYEFLIENGITSFFVNGLASEALMFDVENRVEVVKRAVNVSNGKIPVLGNLIFNNVAMAIECLKKYEEVGVDGIFVTPPLIYKYTEESLYNSFASIASATKLPVYIYNAPETGNKLSPELVAKLFNNISNFQGYKDSTQDVIHQQTLLSLIEEGRHFELMAGSDAQILSTHLMGGCGIISLITCVFPKLITEMWQTIEDKNYAKAQELQGKILRVRAALKVGPFMGAYKYVSELTGSPLGRMSLTLSEVNDAEKQKIKMLLEKEGML